MREIKFRAKRIDNNKWAYGGLVQADDYCIIDQQNELYVEREYNFRGDTHFFQLSGVMCDKTTIGQFTGLKDKSGKEIYEGDILNNGQRNYAVYWNSERGAWWLKNKDLIYTTPLGFLSIEQFVIGSVYDNPELLKGGSNEE